MFDLDLLYDEVTLCDEVTDCDGDCLPCLTLTDCVLRWPCADDRTLKSNN